MARLPQASIDWLKNTETKFSQYTGIEGFSYKEFENKAEKLEKKKPGKGYQIAYEDSMCDLFRKFLDTQVEHKEKAVPLKHFMYYTETLFDNFIGERRVQKMPVSIKIIDGLCTPNLLPKLAKVWCDRNPSTICADVQAKFDRGEYTLWNVHKNAIAKKDTVPTRREAIELISQEQMLRRRNEERPFLLRLLIYPIHLKELNAIEALKTLACKQGNYVDLLREAKYENPLIDDIKWELNEALIELKKRDESNWIEKKDAKMIDAYVKKEMKIDAKGIEDKEFNKILEKIGYGAKEAVLDESLDLGNDVIEDNEKQDNVSFEDLLDNEVDFDADAPNADTLNAFEKVEFDENEFAMFPKNAAVSEFEPEAPFKDNQISK